VHKDDGNMLKKIQVNRVNHLRDMDKTSLLQDCLVMLHDCPELLHGYDQHRKMVQILCFSSRKNRKGPP